MTLLHCPRVPHSPAPKPGKMLFLTAQLLATKWKRRASSRRLLLSGAWKKSAGSSPRFKASPPLRRLLLGPLCTPSHPCLCSGCEELAAQFLSQEIDGQALLLLREDHLISTMNIKLGPALKICASINTLRE